VYRPDETFQVDFIKDTAIFQSQIGHFFSIINFTSVRPKKKCVSGQTVPPKLMRPCMFFLLSREIPDGEKRSEMVVNLILRYEKNGI
jgi:hypothetical protein